MTLLESTELAIAELQAMEPYSYTVDQFERDKMRPNCSIYDQDFEDDDERWGD